MKKVITLINITKFSAYLWLGCIISVFSIFGYVVGYKKETFDVGNESLALAIAGLILLGILFFAVGCLTYTIDSLKSRQNKKTFFFFFLIKLI